ncbi:MAG: hypothetical protein U0414_13765 [Polyangiaceae bacterium]
MFTRPRSLSLSASLLGAALALVGLVGCAATPAPQYVRADALGTGTIDPGRPIVVEFQEGDSIPLELLIDGPFVETPADATAIALRVRRHFFLRLDADGLASSVDGRDFDPGIAEPGRFQFGVSITKEGVAAKMAIRTPTPEGLEGATTKR